MFLTIQTSLLTGAILVLFLENKHLEQNITDRYYERIKPFYHKLTLFAKLVQEFDFAYKYNSKVQHRMCKETKQTIKNLTALAGRSILLGTDLQIMPSKDIDKLCNDINNIWYTHDRYRNEYTSYINFVDYNLRGHLDQIKEAIIAYDPKYSKIEINIDTLPKIAGDFFVEEWQIVQNLTPQYEYWQDKCSFFHKLSIFNIVYVILTIFIYILFPEYEGCIFYAILLGVSLYMFLWCLYNMYNLLKIGNLVIR